MHDKNHFEGLVVKQSGNKRKQKWQEFGSRRGTIGPKGDGRMNAMCKIEEEIKENEENNTQIASDDKKNKECLNDFGEGELLDRPVQIGGKTRGNKRTIRMY